MRHQLKLAIGLVLVGLHASPAAAEPANFYANKQITAIVGNSAGDAYDVWMRFLVPHIGRYIPGNPKIVVQNMPGAGGITAVNYLYNVAPRDGSVFGMISRNIPYMSIAGESNIRADLTKFNWLGSPEEANRVCVVRPASEVKSARDLFDREALIGGTGVGGAPSTIPKLVSSLLGMRLRLVEGYTSPRNVLLAMERGEVDGVCFSILSLEGSRPGWIEAGKLRLLFNMEEERLSGRDAPSIFEFTKSDEERMILRLFNAGAIFGRPIVAPQGVPEDRVKVLKAAFEKAMADPQLIEQAKKNSLEVGVVKGEMLAKLMLQLTSTPRELVDRLKTHMQ